MVGGVITSYYILGGESFPDYKAYINIAYNDFGGEGWYFSEFLTRYILYNDVMFGLNRVDQLTLFVQLFFILITLALIIADNKNTYMVLVFVSFFSPLLMTTVLRASPLYVLFFFMSAVYFKEKLLMRHIILLALLGSLFHDSFFVISLTLFVVYLFCFTKVKFSNVFFKVILVLSFISIFLLPWFISSIILFFQKLGLGARSVYINDDGFTLAKIVFLIILNVISFMYLSCENGSYNQKFIATSLTIVTNLIFSVGSTAGIRFSIFAFSYLFVVRQCFLFRFESYKLNNQVYCGSLLFVLLYLRYLLLL